MDGKPLRVGDQFPDSHVLGSILGQGLCSGLPHTHLLRFKCRHFRRWSVFLRKAPPPIRGTLGYNRVGLHQQAWSEMGLDWDRS